jgi:hypothetical protein
MVVNYFFYTDARLCWRLLQLFCCTERLLVMIDNLLLASYLGDIIETVLV